MIKTRVKFSDLKKKNKKKNGRARAMGFQRETITHTPPQESSTDCPRGD